MENKNTLKILVDDLGGTRAKGIPSADEVLKIFLIDIDADHVQKNLDATIRSLFSILAKSTLESNDFRVERIDFTLNINASGEVSLLSIAKGSIGSQAGLTFTINRR
jgi:hypothetical protein